MMTLDLLMCGSGPEMFQGSVNGHAKSGFYFSHSLATSLPLCYSVLM